MKKDIKIRSTQNAILSKTDVQKIRPYTQFSIEIYPPRTTQGREKLLKILECYVNLGITHVNVTGKIERNYETLDLVRFLKAKLPSLIVVPHLVGYGLSKAKCRDLIHHYVEMGITNIFVVRGDILHDDTSHLSKMDFPYASDLVYEIKRLYSHVCVGVAGYPSGHHEQPNFLDDMRNLKHKVEAGADYIITQLFFDNREFSEFVKRCRIFSIEVPIIPGITYVKSPQHIDRISSLALGSLIPSQLLQRMYNAKNEKDSYAIGEAWLKNQVQSFVQNKEPLVHFYVFNGNQPFDTLIRDNSTEPVFPHDVEVC